MASAASACTSASALNHPNCGVLFEETRSQVTGFKDIGVTRTRTSPVVSDVPNDPNVPVPDAVVESNNKYHGNTPVTQVTSRNQQASSLLVAGAENENVVADTAPVLARPFHVQKDIAWRIRIVGVADQSAAHVSDEL